jgi:hypothetical protein
MWTRSVVLDFVRKGAFTSLLWVELIWPGLLWVLWLATGGTAAAALATKCDIDFCNTPIDPQGDALAALSFINWVMRTLFILAFSS